MKQPNELPSAPSFKVAAAWSTIAHPILPAAGARCSNRVPAYLLDRVSFNWVLVCFGTSQAIGAELKIPAEPLQVSATLEQNAAKRVAIRPSSESG